MGHFRKLSKKFGSSMETLTEKPKGGNGKFLRII